MKHRAIVATGLALAMTSSMPLASTAAIIQGTHSIILGVGQIHPQGYNVSETGPVNNHGMSGPGTYQVSFNVRDSDTSGLIQYLYHVTPGLGLGITSAFHHLHSLSYAHYNSGPPVEAGIYQTYGTVIEAIPMARYTWLPSHSVNPYVIGGLGAHYSYLYPKMVDWTTPQTHVSSIGLSILLGAGFEISVKDNFLIGSEGRITTMSPFGITTGFFGWLGWKWVAPL